eukprot:1304161-Amorphochlora_amoeboformis.AAC.1
MHAYMYSTRIKELFQVWGTFRAVWEASVLSAQFRDLASAGASTGKITSGFGLIVHVLTSLFLIFEVKISGGYTDKGNIQISTDFDQKNAFMAKKTARLERLSGFFASAEEKEWRKELRIRRGGVEGEKGDR